jgi:hypothetical protein
MLKDSEIDACRIVVVQRSEGVVIDQFTDLANGSH